MHVSLLLLDRKLVADVKRFVGDRVGGGGRSLACCFCNKGVLQFVST